MSNADTEYRFRVTLYDKAGTRKVLPDQKFLFDSDLGEYTLVAVYDPTAETSVIPGFSKGYVEYKSGMTVNLNPITFVYRVPSTNRREYRKGGLAFGNIISEANGYSYVSVTTLTRRSLLSITVISGGPVLPTILKWVQMRR